MNERDPVPDSPTLAAPPAQLPSVGLTIACTLHALPLGWGAWMLPVSVSSWLALSLGLLALLHGAVALLALLQRRTALRWVWLTLSVYSLVLLLGVTIVAGSAAVYLSGLYQDIGVAVSAGLVIFWGLLVLLTVPVSAWGLAYCWPVRRSLRRKPALIAGASTFLVLLSSVLLLRGAARAASVPGADDPAQLTSLTRIAQQASASVPAREAGSLLQLEPIRCAAPVSEAALTLLVTALGQDTRSFAVCLQARSMPALQESLARVLRERQQPGTPLKLDLVRGVQKLVRVHPLLDALSLRPALDGVCNELACYAPWQLVPLDAFTRFHPLAAVPDARFGASLEELAQSLGSASPRDAALFRIETTSLLFEQGQSAPYLRMRPAALATDDTARKRAVALAGAHIIKAQRPDGGFRYLLDPFNGQTQDRLNLPRQAGTTLALCELVPGPEAQLVATRALGQLRNFEQKSGAVSAISDNNVRAELGPTALPLIAFASCRERVGEQNDELIGRLARFLLTMQRTDGSFYPELELASTQPVGAYEPIYAGGQAVLALVLVERMAKAKPSPHWPASDELSGAVESAMAFYAQHYWPRALRSLFYIEENWHCLAARAALGTHRHEDYEQFCLDYVAFKSRVILEPDDGVSPEHLGGYGLSDMFPPHSTATAGFGEALAAAVAIKHARGMDLRADQARMQLALSFVLRQQWTRDNCFACAPSKEAVGGFSESEASSMIRIDYVQHAMAALGHGGAALALASPEH